MCAICIESDAYFFLIPLYFFPFVAVIVNVNEIWTHMGIHNLKKNYFMYFYVT